LDQKGSSSDKQFRLSANTRSLIGKVSLNVKNENLFGSLSKLGFTNENVESQTVTVPIIIALGQDSSYQALKFVTYKAKKGKTGAAK
jgi:hypothetical protein